MPESAAADAVDEGHALAPSAKADGARAGAAKALVMRAASRSRKAAATRDGVKPAPALQNAVSGASQRLRGPGSSRLSARKRNHRGSHAKRDAAKSAPTNRARLSRPRHLVPGRRSPTFAMIAMTMRRRPFPAPSRAPPRTPTRRRRSVRSPATSRLSSGNRRGPSKPPANNQGRRDRGSAPITSPQSRSILCRITKRAFLYLKGAFFSVAVLLDRLGSSRPALVQRISLTAVKRYARGVREDLEHVPLTAPPQRTTASQVILAPQH